MQTKKAKIMLSFFVFLLLINSISLVFAIDEYGNQLTTTTIYQKVGSTDFTLGTFTNTTFVSDTNYTMINGESPIYFRTKSYVNSTFCPYQNVTYQFAMGIQVFADSDNYQNPMYWITPYQKIGDFWEVPFSSDYVEIEFSELNVCNITVWVNYQNGSSWLMIEEYEFNLIYDFLEPPATDDSMASVMNVIYFWLFIISLFSTTINSVLVFRIGEGKYVTFALMSFAFTITFLATIMNG